MGKGAIEIYSSLQAVVVQGLKRLRKDFVISKYDDCNNLHFHCGLYVDRNGKLD